MLTPPRESEKPVNGPGGDVEMTPAQAASTMPRAQVMTRPARKGPK